MFLQVQIDEIEKKMSKILKNKKINSKPRNLKKEIISHIYFFKKNF